MSFNLPYFTPSLASGDNITQMCGPLVYTVTINSNNPGPYDEAFSVEIHDGNELKPVVVTVETDKQEFALHDGVSDQTWSTEYVFKITAIWSKHTG